MTDVDLGRDRVRSYTLVDNGISFKFDNDRSVVFNSNQLSGLMDDIRETNSLRKATNIDLIVYAFAIESEKQL